MNLSRCRGLAINALRRHHIAAYHPTPNLILNMVKRGIREYIIGGMTGDRIVEFYERGGFYPRVPFVITAPDIWGFL